MPSAPTSTPQLTRRSVLRRAGATLGATLGAVWAGRLAEAVDAAPGAAPAGAVVTLGSCGSMGKAEMLKAAGGAYVEESVQGLLIPEKDAGAFAGKVAAIAACALPVKCCNGFLPGSLKSVGPMAAHDAILAYAATAFARAKQVGIETVTFGSGASRQIPDGFPPEQALDQFAELLRKMGPLAAAQGVVVSVEPLRKAECNFLNRIGEVAVAVSRANHPSVGITADLYHMVIGGDTGDDLEKALPLLRHFHIAEKATRSIPGAAGDDFRPFFRVLAKHAWKGRMSIEANGAGGEAAYRAGFDYLRAQARDAGI
jgi:sugar phosphate isomerase/epimerase